MIRKAFLTDRQVKALEVPASGEYAVHDEKQKGFAVRVRASGAKAFVAIYRLKGGRRGAVRRYTIGNPDRVHVTAAREKAKEIIAKAALDNDPASEKTARRKAKNVAELCAAYFDAGANGNKPSTVYRDRGRVERHILPLIGKLPARDINGADVERLRRSIASGKTAADVLTGNKRGRAIVRGGEGAARRVVGLLGSIFSFAVREGIRRDNPVRNVRRGKDGKRQRFLSPAELAKLGEALRGAETNGTNKKALAILRLLVFTGARMGEIIGLRWNEVDLERGMLALGDSKTGAKVIMLSPPSAAVLSEIEKGHGSPFVFPSDDGDGFFQGTPKIWRKVRTAAGLTDVRIHDLRHSFASVGLAGGDALPVIGKLLGHADVKTTSRYAHLADDPLRAAATRISGRIASAMDGNPAADVVPLRKQN
jgi:integrase